MYRVPKQAVLSLSISAQYVLFEWCLANLALKLLPDVRVDIVSLFAVTFACQPFL